MNSKSSKNTTTSCLMKMLAEIVENDQKREDGFVSVAPIAFWTQLFAKYFLHVNNPQHDDLLFYIKKCVDPDSQPEVQVFRRESTKAPGLGDPAYDWTETVYLNLILQQLEYTLTCGICTESVPKKDVCVHKKISQKVYASPSKHDMEEKGKSAELCYPNIFFTVDSFDESKARNCVSLQLKSRQTAKLARLIEVIPNNAPDMILLLNFTGFPQATFWCMHLVPDKVWNDLVLNEDEMVCVEIIACDKARMFQSVIFLGSVNYSALMKVYNNRTRGSAKWAQVMTLGLLRNHNSTEFVRMKGPNAKGYAEMAIRRYSKSDDTSSSHDQCTCSSGSSSNQPMTSCSVHSLHSSKSDPSLDRSVKLSSGHTNGVGQANSSFELSAKKPAEVSQRTSLKTSNTLKTHLTYVTLPWHKIILDVLQSFEKPSSSKRPILNRKTFSKT